MRIGVGRMASVSAASPVHPFLSDRRHRHHPLHFRCSSWPPAAASAASSAARRQACLPSPSHRSCRLCCSALPASEDAPSSSSAPASGPTGGVENLVIIGSGPAGYTAAIYAARANLKPLVFEGYQVGGVPGGQLMTTTEVENFPGFPDGITGPDLMDRMRRQAERWGAELFQEDVEYIDVKNRPFTIRSSDREVKCHSVIFATGATAKRLRLPREDEFWSRGISACAICDGASPLFKGQVLAVVGGGDTATEEALYLTKYARHVHLLVRSNQLRASKAMQDRVFNNANITVHFNTKTMDVVSNNKGQMSGILLQRADTKEEFVLDVKGLFYGIGHTPNSQLLKGQVELDSAGYVLVKEGCATTSVEGVFAAGDVQDHEWRQAVTAAGSGCISALSVERYLAANGLLMAALWQELLEFHLLSGRPWCLGGDFNAVSSSSERTGSSPAGEVEDFCDFIHGAALIDVGLVNAQFTWSNARERPSSSRIDRFLVSVEWEAHFPQLQSSCLARVGSDHKPILLSSNHRYRKKHMFRFKKFWLMEAGFLDLVRASWSEVAFHGGGMAVWVKKLSHLTHVLSTWGKSKRLPGRQHKEDLLQQIQAMDLLEDSGLMEEDDRVTRASLKAEYEEIIMREEVYWKQRSREKWIKEGDMNTAYFHRFASAKRRLNYIAKLKVGSRTYHKEEDIRLKAKEFFSNLFSEEQADRPVFHGDRLPHLSLVQSEELIAPFQEEEVRQAVFALAGDKAPGPDGYPVIFFQPVREEAKKEISDRDVEMGFDITLTKHKGQYALRKLYHESPRLICVLYTSPTCGPCRTLKPILGKVIDEYDQNVHFVEIDIEEDPEITEAAGIMGTPCVQFFKNKELLRTVSGVKMKKEYREFIDANK